MPEGQVLEFSAVTKRFGAVTAVDDFSARVEPGLVTGFLGPNGAGKTTTLRILLGLVRATAGTTTIGGVPYAKLAHPLRSVGAVLEASSFHPGRSAANHLKIYAQAAGLPAARVDEALGLVGLGDVAGRKVGGYSLGMRQRLGLAYALIGDPGVLVLDEPANGLDPEGIRWMRGLLRDLAGQGRTVLVSSHLLAEVQQTVDSLLIISAGRLVFQGALSDLADPGEYATVVDAGDRAALSTALHAADADFEVLRSGLTVRGLDTAQVGRIAADAGVALTSLQRRGPALEEIFLDLVNGTRVHASAGEQTETAPDAAPPAAGAPVAEEAAVAAVAGGEAADDEHADDVPDDEGAAAGAPGGTLAVVAAGAGTALVAGAVAAGVVAGGDDDDDETEPLEGPDIEVASDAEAPAGAHPAAAADEDAEAAEALAEDAPPAAAFAVASTGIIDIVPIAAAGDEASDETSAEPGEADEDGSDIEEEFFSYDDPADADADAPADAEADGDADAPADAEAEGDAEGSAVPAAEPDAWAEPEPAPAPESAADAEDADDAGDLPPVAAERREWRAPAGWAEPVEWKAPASWTAANPIVAEDEAAAANAQAAEQSDVDGEPEGAEAESVEAPAESDRPWEDFVKTDADREADRFFAAFDSSGADEASVRPDGEPVTQLETPSAEDLGGESPGWHPQPEPLAPVGEGDETDDPGADEGPGGEDAADRDAQTESEGGEPR
ncbi:ABC transporter ATP-binding protein [Microbacterium sp. SS28]|uniref:ABC transporter ATP-binding protein n=1 Tax=Microbacterium sp. SS28 TaxID=2919948 RepID=UPI001FA951F6|nr:ABC transporter ATP-binding protein [Microbacterium sp. SS28]